ncbi:unnamed protein product [Ectocarpus sp. 8 AP-2014]
MANPGMLHGVPLTQVRRSTGSSVAHSTQLMMTLTIGTVIGLVFAWQIGKR